MNTVCAKGPLVRGIDIYHGDMISDFDLLAHSGVQYAFLKAFEYKVDPMFASRKAELKKRGILCGAYDFFHPLKDPIQQADDFLKIIGTLDDSDLPCSLDWETTDGLPSSKDVTAGLTWLLHVEKLTGKTPLVYTSPFFAKALSLDPRFARFPLWIAQYGVRCPLVPVPWTDWTFWQTSETGSLPGVKGHIDLDVFNGTIDDLKIFAAKKIAA